MKSRFDCLCETWGHELFKRTILNNRLANISKAHLSLSLHATHAVSKGFLILIKRLVLQSDI